MRTLPMTRLRTLNILIKVVNTSLPSTVVNLFNLWPMSSNGSSLLTVFIVMFFSMAFVLVNQ